MKRENSPGPPCPCLIAAFDGMPVRGRRELRLSPQEVEELQALFPRRRLPARRPHSGRQALVLGAVVSVWGTCRHVRKTGEEQIIVWEELGISGGTALLVLIALYFVIKWAVKNGIREALNIKEEMSQLEKEKDEKLVKDLFSAQDNKKDQS